MGGHYDESIRRHELCAQRQGAAVVKPGEFIFSAAHLDHGHIYGMTNGLLEAGGTLKYVYDPDPKKVEAFVKAYPQVKVARSEEELLNDKETNMVCGAAITNERCALGLRAMQAGKDYFTDKAPFTTLEQLDSAKKMVAQTGKKYMVYYGERLHVEGAVLAGNLIEQGAIGKVIHVEGFGPHRLGAAGRPQWFFEKEKYGGILCDIGSHQIEQYLFYAGEEDGTVSRSRIANYAHPQYPGAGRLRRLRHQRCKRHDVLLPRGLVHAGRLADVGRRAHHHHRHEGVH